MKCPECHKEITEVKVYSQAVQIAKVNGNEINPFLYGTPELLDTQVIEHDCGADITVLINENPKL